MQALIRALAAKGHQITALCSSIGEGDPGALPAELHEIAPDAAEAVAWDALEREPAVINHHLERDLRSLEWNRWVIGRAPEIFDGEAPDLIYERYALFGWAGQSIARREGIPHVLEVNAPLCDEQMGYERFTLTETARRLEAVVVGLTGAEHKRPRAVPGPAEGMPRSVTRRSLSYS